MKRYMTIGIALLAVLAIAAPSFAGVEFKYGGLYRARLQSNQNITDGTDLVEDNSNWIDQRIRMYFSFIASERLQMVTKWEADTVWGNETAGAGRHGGGDVGSDAVNLEMKNAYIDFLIPQTPVRATVGVQGIALMKGWIVDDDFSAAVLSTKYDPVDIKLGYIAARNEDVSSYPSDNIDDVFGAVEFKQGPFSGGFNVFWQNANRDPISTQFARNTPSTSQNANNTTSVWRLIDSVARQNTAVGAASAYVPPATTNNAANLGYVEDNNLVDLGISLGYKMDWLNVFVNYVQNLGSYDAVGNASGRRVFVGDGNYDYRGYMVEAAANVAFNPFTFTVGGFYTSGDTDFSLNDNGGTDGNYRSVRGVSHYWSEIMGLGVLDASVTDAGDRQNLFGQYRGDYGVGDAPYNLWTVSVGAAWQILEGTKFTANYYYIQTARKVLADGFSLSAAGVPVPNGNPNNLSRDIGHEFDVYLDQDIVDGLKLKLVAAYLIAGDAYTVLADDDDTYELGAVLQWAF